MVKIIKEACMNQNNQLINWHDVRVELPEIEDTWSLPCLVLLKSGDISWDHYNGEEWYDYEGDIIAWCHMLELKQTVPKCFLERIKTVKEQPVEVKTKTNTQGICRICGCTWNNACTHPEYGNCWWVDQEETLCSHCTD